MGLFIERIDLHATLSVGKRAFVGTETFRQLAKNGDMKLSESLALARAPLLKAEAAREVETFGELAAK
jgi:hypothetical protein